MAKAKKTPTRKKSGRGRPPTLHDGISAETPIFARVDDATIQRIEAHQERMRSAAPGSRISLSDSIRGLLLAGLDVKERASR